MSPKHPLILLLGLIFLAGCSLLGQDPGQSAAALSTQQAREFKIATLVQGTQQVAEQQTQTAPTPSPTPGSLPIGAALLEGPDLNALLDAWPDTANEQLNLTNDPLCVDDCAGRLWLARLGSGQLSIRLYQASGRDHAVTLLQELRQAQEDAGIEALALPSITNLPPETWVVFDEGAQAYMLHTRQGKAIVEVWLQMPNLDAEQNVLLISLYAEQQVETLKNSGF